MHWYGSVHVSPTPRRPGVIVALLQVVSADSGQWSEEQELALVKAMKQFGKELEDRWDRIATVVPGKTKAQCFKRFKELREVFKAKKSGGAE